jgi:hypothetical protein
MKEYLDKFLSRKFLVTLSVCITAILQTNLIPPEHAVYKALVAVVAVLAALGYVWVQGAIDKEAVKPPQ